VGNAQTELAGRPIDIVEDLAADLPRLRLDPRALRHVFVNLFTTELRKLHAGGTLTVQTRAITLAPASLSATLPPPPPKAAVQLRIESRLREAPPAAATTRSPTDFGLLVMKKVIELYGGRVEFAPTETGSRFDLTFST
jgi:hypothetical protein